jgi:hypothetical protein
MLTSPRLSIDVPSADQYFLESSTVTVAGRALDLMASAGPMAFSTSVSRSLPAD